MEIVMRETSKLIPYINNPRNNKNAVDKVASSIKEFGFKVPIIIDKDGVIVTGHTRLLAAQKLGIMEVPLHNSRRFDTGANKGVPHSR